MAGGGESKGTGITPLDWLIWWIKFCFNLKDQVKYVGDWGISRALYLSILYGGLLFILAHLIPNLPFFAFQWMLGTAPLWMPIGLWMACWGAWVWYIQALFLSSRSPILLEVKMPREITKSPRAMELALTGLSISSGETSYVHRGWRGQIRTYFSLELVSFGGQIHFYIWCWKNYRAAVETTLYAQYPEIELVEVEDYASKFQYDPDTYAAFCTDYIRDTHASGDIPAYSRNVDAYPIRTYVDFELDKDPKEEFRVEPLAQVIEFLGSLSPSEQAWVQIVFRKAGNYDGTLKPKDMAEEWESAVRSEINRIRFEATSKPKDPSGHEPENDTRASFPHPTEAQKDQLQAMTRNFGKFPFEVGMRGIYLSTIGLQGTSYSGLRYIWRAFNNPQFRSQLKPKRWTNDFDYSWQDIFGFRDKLVTRRFLDAYRRRSFFTSPWKTPTFVMTNEEIASLWHPPSSTIQTPGLERIPAKKASAPSNLPR
jgi:hypothetical protein